jgi:hypothetical protein
MPRLKKEFAPIWRKSIKRLCGGGEANANTPSPGTAGDQGSGAAAAGTQGGRGEEGKRKGISYMRVLGEMISIFK